MTKNLILAGVGGQGVLSIAYCLCNAARNRGLKFKQSEVHGMAQRGGAVVSHLRISPDPIYSDLVANGTADMVVSLEPLEGLRYTHMLAPEGVLVSNSTPVTNIPDYPNLDSVLERITKVPHHVLLDASALAVVAGSGRATNMVMAGAAGWLLGFTVVELEEHARTLFAEKAERVVRANCNALRVGRYAAKLYAAARSAGQTSLQALHELSGLAPAELMARVEDDLAQAPAQPRCIA